MGQEMLVTYLITTWNRKEILRQHLALLMEQSWPYWFEVIVCVDGSTDGTQEMVASMRNTSKYTLQFHDTGSVEENTAAKARNLGLKHAKGDMIVMADDDCWPHPQLIEKYAERFNPTQVQLGYKSCTEANLRESLPVPIEEGNPTIWMRDHLAGVFCHFQTGTCAMSREAANIPTKQGGKGFDERFVGYGHEDTEFGRRLLALGYRLIFNPDAVIWHVNAGIAPQQDPVKKQEGIKRSNEMLQMILGEAWPK